MESDEEETDKGDISLDDSLLSALLSDVKITREQALNIPAVSACINVIASTISGIPIKLYRQSEGKTEVQKDDIRLFLLNKDTGDTLTTTQFWRAMLEDYFLGNGAYAYIRKEYSVPVGLHYVPSSCVSILHNNDHIFKSYSIMVDGRRYSDFEFFKLLRNSKNGWNSKPLMEENGLVLSTAYKEFMMENSFASKGGTKRGFIRSESHLRDEQITKLKRAFRRLFGTGEENMVVLPKGSEFQECSNTSVEMQLNENKETNVKEVVSLFNVPVSIIQGNATKEDYTNFIKLAVVPRLNEIETELNKLFLLEEEKSEFYFAFDTRILTRGSIDERYEAYKKGLDANFLMIDEVRDMEDMPPLGIDFIKLGLDAVLYNPDSKTAYTPNINAISSINGKGGKEDESKNQV